MQGSGSLYSEFSNAEVDFKVVTVHITRAIMEHENGKPDVLMVLMRSRKHSNIWLVISIYYFKNRYSVRKGQNQNLNLGPSDTKVCILVIKLYCSSWDYRKEPYNSSLEELIDNITQRKYP